jgi:predicted nucleic acid-binding protein
LIFCDASVLLAAEDVDDSDHEDALALLCSGQVLATLDLALYEVANVAAVRWRDPDAAVRLQERISAIADYGELVRADRSLIEDATRLATQHSLSVYDAAYLAGADRLTALASCDRRGLVGAGHARTPHDLLPPGE